MAQSLSKIYVHITFSTKNRHPFIDSAIEQELWAYLGGTCKALECYPVRIGGFHDHVHICCVLSKKITPIKLLETIKRQSSMWIKTKGVSYENFYWQDGYGIFSINPSGIKAVVEYIENQNKHHAARSFQEEFLAFLKR